MNDMTPTTIRLIRERAEHQGEHAPAHEMPVTTLLDYAEQLESENRRLLRGIEAISTLAGGEGRRLARLILEGADTHLWWLGRQPREQEEGATWSTGN